MCTECDRGVTVAQTCTQVFTEGYCEKSCLESQVETSLKLRRVCTTISGQHHCRRVHCLTLVCATRCGYSFSGSSHLKRWKRHLKTELMCQVWQVMSASPPDLSEPQYGHARGQAVYSYATSYNATSMLQTSGMFQILHSQRECCDAAVVNATHISVDVRDTGPTPRTCTVKLESSGRRHSSSTLTIDPDHKLPSQTLPTSVSLLSCQRILCISMRGSLSCSAVNDAGLQGLVKHECQSNPGHRLEPKSDKYLKRQGHSSLATAVGYVFRNACSLLPKVYSHMSKTPSVTT